MKTLSISLFALLAAATANAAAYTEHYNYKGNGADAWLNSWDDCGYSYGNVWITAQKQLGPNSWSGQYGYLWFERQNWCTGEYSYGSADLSSATFTSSGARGATLSYSGTGWTQEFLGCEWVDEPYCWTECWWDDVNGIEVCQEVCNPEPGYEICQWDYVEVPVTVDLAWTPTDTYRGVNNNQSKGPSYVSRSRTVGTQGYGPVSGGVSFDGFELDGDTWGSCWAATSGSTWMYHYNG